MKGRIRREQKHNYLDHSIIIQTKTRKKSKGKKWKEGERTKRGHREEKREQGWGCRVEEKSCGGPPAIVVRGLGVSG